jgi:hypothetical protein
LINIRVEYVLDKKVEDVFTAISDHENYYRFPGFTDSLLLEPGHSEKNGRGALRLLKAGRASFKERITYFESPVRRQTLWNQLALFLRDTFLPVASPV